MKKYMLGIKSKMASNKAHSEDRVVEKEAKELKTKKPEHGIKNNDVGSFEAAHVVVDKEAHGIKMSREKQKASHVMKQDYSMGVGEPPASSAHLPHHEPHSKGVYMSDESID